MSISLFNQVVLEGRIGSDLILKFTKDNTAYLRFNLAHNSGYLKNDLWIENVSWFSILAWRDVAIKISDNFNKGDEILIHGRLESEKFKIDEKRNFNYVTIVIDKFKKL